MTTMLTQQPHCLLPQLPARSGLRSCSASAALMPSPTPSPVPVLAEELLDNVPDCNGVVDARPLCAPPRPSSGPAVFPCAPMPELEPSGWQEMAIAPPYTPRVPFGHTHHPSLGHVELLYMQHAAQPHDFYVELHPFPARHALDARMTTLLEQLDIISGDALQAMPGAGRAMEEVHRQQLGHTRPSSYGLGAAHILHQLQPTLALVLIRDAVSHCARYYLRWDVYHGVMGAPVGFAVYRWQSEQKTYGCMGSWTRFMCRQQILRQRLQPAQQEQLRRVLLQVNRRYTSPVGSRARVSRGSSGTQPWAGGRQQQQQSASTPSSCLLSSSSSARLEPFVVENTLCMVQRTDNTRLLESRMKLSAAQFPDFTYVGSELPAIADALLVWCQQHDSMGLWQRLVDEGVVVSTQPGHWSIDLRQLSHVVRCALSQQERAAVEELTCAHFRQGRGALVLALTVAIEAGSAADDACEPCTTQERCNHDVVKEEDGVLDSSMLVWRLSQLRAQHPQELTSWSEAIGQLYAYLRCLYRSTVPSRVAEMLDGVMRVSFEGVASLRPADAYMWCVRNASPSVTRNVNKQAATVPLINDIYALLASNSEAQGDSRNYLLNVLLMDLDALAESRWEAPD